MTIKQLQEYIDGRGVNATVFDSFSELVNTYDGFDNNDWCLYIAKSNATEAVDKKNNYIIVDADCERLLFFETMQEITEYIDDRYSLIKEYE